ADADRRRARPLRVFHPVRRSARAGGARAAAAARRASFVPRDLSRYRACPARVLVGGGRGSPPHPSRHHAGRSRAFRHPKPASDVAANRRGDAAVAGAADALAVAIVHRRLVLGACSRERTRNGRQQGAFWRKERSMSTSYIAAPAMSPEPKPSVGGRNRLLAALPSADLALLTPHLVEISLETGAVLQEPAH